MPYVMLIDRLPIDDEPGSGRARGSLIEIHDPALEPATLCSSIESIFGLGEPAARLVAEIFEGVDSKSLQNSNAESS
jgi:hypothetical protein